MEMPFFYIAQYEPGANEMVLDEDNSRHVVQVLRMENEERLRLTDGKGAQIDATIVDAHKKKCRVRVDGVKMVPPRGNAVTIGISLVKNASRFEWFLEKATEMGISAIIPLLCERTERQHFRLDRMRQILVSAMLQSQQCWLPELSEPKSFDEVVGAVHEGRIFIAHCIEEERTSLATLIGTFRAADGASKTGSFVDAEKTDSFGDVKKLGQFGPSTILIGPEGDFSPKEIEAALARGYRPVMLGQTRLRTETAGVVAAAILAIE